MGLGIMFTYPDAVSCIKELKKEFNGQNFPAAKDLANKLITLPVHPFVSQLDKRRIARLFTKIMNC